MFELKVQEGEEHTYWIYAFYHFCCASAFILLNVFLNLALKNLANRVRPYQTNSFALNTNDCHVEYVGFLQKNTIKSKCK